MRSHTCSDGTLDRIDNLSTLLYILGIVKASFDTGARIFLPFAFAVNAELALQPFKFRLLCFLLSFLPLGFALEISSKTVKKGREISMRLRNELEGET